MGLFKSLGSLAGTVIGGVVGGTVELVGGFTNIKLLREVGEGVYKSSIKGCEMIGQAVDGSVSIADGIISNNKEKINKGFGEVGDTVFKTVVGIGNGIGSVAKSSIQIVEGISEGDSGKISNGSKNIAKAVAIGALAVGVLDVLDIVGDDIDTSDVYIDDIDDMGGIDTDVDDIDEIDVTTEDIGYSDVYIDDVDNMDGVDTDGDGIDDAHYVEPHYVEGYERTDGTSVEGYWRDGDGDTSVNLTEAQGGGYIRSNPQV